MSTQQAESSPVQALGNGLVLRWSTPADIERICQLTGYVFRGSADEPLNVRMMDQIRIALRGDFPFMQPTDFALIEDQSQAEQPLVACTCLMQHTWSYGGIRFGVGRPEFVATLPDYRNRGLVRALFKAVHQRSEARGDLLQCITGIPYFYRQFGYEYVLDLGGSRTVYQHLLPEQKEGEVAKCTIRPATVTDIPTLMALCARNSQQSLLSHEAPESYWRYLITYWDDPAIRQGDAWKIGINDRPYMILDQAGRICGYMTFSVLRWAKGLGVYDLVAAPEVNLQELLPALLHKLADYGRQSQAMRTNAPAFSEINFVLGRNHPVYALLGQELAPKVDTPYAWYIRVPDMPAFLQRIAPVLEERLRHSIFGAYTGAIKLDFYRSGLHLAFTEGKLVTAEAWRPPTYGDNANGGFPPLVFLQLLLGYRSLDELCAHYPDVWAKPELEPLLNTLFPKQYSLVKPLA
ncbi:MAG: GNAT family N-acetyltransferase [Caldilineaceae bacterium]